MNVSEILSPWEAVNAALGLSMPIKDEAHYNEMLAFVDTCFERFGGDENHSIFALVDLVAERIRAYEDLAHPWPALAPHELLRELMTEYGLRQCDLPEVGGQSVVSEVLSGKRALNLRQVQALAKRFSVPMEVFAG